MSDNIKTVKSCQEISTACPVSPGLVTSSQRAVTPGQLRPYTSSLHICVPTIPGHHLVCSDCVSSLSQGPFPSSLEPPSCSYQNQEGCLFPPRPQESLWLQPHNGTSPLPQPFSVVLLCPLLTKRFPVTFQVLQNHSIMYTRLRKKVNSIYLENSIK